MYNILLMNKKKWQATFKQSGINLKETINKLLSANTTESLHQLASILASADVQSTFDTDSEITHACFIFAIYRTELKLEENDVHKLPEGAHSITDLIQVFRQIKFLLLNIEFDLDADSALKNLSYFIKTKQLSVTAVTYIIQASCINKSSVFTQLIKQLKSDLAFYPSIQLENNFNQIKQNEHLDEHPDKISAKISDGNSNGIPDKLSPDFIKSDDISLQKSNSEDSSTQDSSHTFCFIICSNNKQYEDECLHYISSLSVPFGYTVTAITINDAHSMTSGYQKGMSSCDAKYKIYLHQDVFITNKNILFDILEIFKDNKIGMIGMVGSIKLPKTAIMWNGPRFGNLYVNKICTSVNCSFDISVTSSSNDISSTTARNNTTNNTINKTLVPVEAIDGLMMITQYDIPWRTDLFTGWDFYDISQCFEFKKAGLQIVVPDCNKPWCFHDEGMSNLDNYYKFREIFINEYLN